MIELSETGPLDGTEMSIPEGQQEVITQEWDGLNRFQVVYERTNFRNQRTGAMIFKRKSRTKVEAT